MGRLASGRGSGEGRAGILSLVYRYGGNLDGNNGSIPSSVLGRIMVHYSTFDTEDDNRESPSGRIVHCQSQSLLQIILLCSIYQAYS